MIDQASIYDAILKLSQPTLKALRLVIVCLRQDNLSGTVPLFAFHSGFKFVDK